MQNFKAIFFDFDGTIADTVNGILATMTATFKELNLPVPPQDAMKSASALSVACYPPQFWQYSLFRCSSYW